MCFVAIAAYQPTQWTFVHHSRSYTSVTFFELLTVFQNVSDFAVLYKISVAATSFCLTITYHIHWFSLDFFVKLFCSTKRIALTVWIISEI